MENIEKKNVTYIAKFVLCLFLLLIFLSNPTVSSSHLKRGLIICYETLIPSLFPFMVISEILVRTDISTISSKIFSKSMQSLFGVSGAGAPALILGIICGFPVGAKTAASLYENRCISKKDAEKLMTFCNIPSAPFMIFAVGDKLFGSRKIGIFLYLNTLIISLLCGIIVNVIIGKRKHPHNHFLETDIRIPPAPLIKIFSDSISTAAHSAINICAYVCFFICGIGTLSEIIPSSHRILSTCIFSVFELTSGALYCSSVEPRSLGFILAAIAAGWSGLSVFFQIYSLSETKLGPISLRPYIISKSLCSLFCGISAALAIKFFPSLVSSSLPDTDVSLKPMILPDSLVSVFNLFFILSLLFYLSKQLDIRRKI